MNHGRSLMKQIFSWLLIALFAWTMCLAQEREEEYEKPVSKPSPILIETIPPRTALVISMSGSYDQHSEAFGQLYTYLGEKGVKLGLPFGIYFNKPGDVPEDSLKWMIGVELLEEIEAEDPLLEIQETPEIQTAAVMICTGPYGEGRPCYAAMEQWIEEKGYAVSGPCREVWLDDIMKTAPADLRTKIVFPVEKK